MSAKILIKGCKKCKGDLYMEHDEDGYYLSCIQCATVDMEMTRLLQKYATQRKKMSTKQRLNKREKVTTSKQFYQVIPDCMTTRQRGLSMQ